MRAARAGRRLSNSSNVSYAECARTDTRCPPFRLLHQGRQRLTTERQDVALTPLAHLHRPIRIHQQGTAHGDQVELVFIEALQQLFQAGRLRDLVGVDHELQELAVQADAANGDGRLAGELARPTGQVEVGTFEFRLPETTR